MRYRAIVIRSDRLNSPVIGEGGRPIQIMGNNFEIVKKAAMIVLESYPNAEVAIYELVEILRENLYVQTNLSS